MQTTTGAAAAGRDVAEDCGSPSASPAPRVGVEEAGSEAVPFPRSSCSDGDPGDGGEVIKLRPWRCRQKVQKKGENFQREIGSDLGGEGRWRRRQAVEMN